MERQQVTQYLTPLREGGSLPGLVEADDLGTYVCKFIGAGQGARVLVAETIAAGIADLLGLRTPRLVALELDPQLARYEADEEVQDLLNASAGLNLGVDFLPGAFGIEGALPVQADDDPTAAQIVWFDAFIANVDRSWHNPNLLWWHHALWVIDHGAALYFHHAWQGGLTDPRRFANQPWDPDRHVLGRHLPAALALDESSRARLKPDALRTVVAEVPDEWLDPVPGADSPQALREAYVEFLTARLASTAWLPEPPA